jgi:hypothetical protein
MEVGMPTVPKTARIETGYARDDFVAVVESLLPGVRAWVEGLGLYLLVVAIWGMALFVAATFANPW